MQSRSEQKTFIDVLLYLIVIYFLKFLVCMISLLFSRIPKGDPSPFFPPTDLSLGTDDSRNEKFVNGFAN